MRKFASLAPLRVRQNAWRGLCRPAGLVLVVAFAVTGTVGGADPVGERRESLRTHFLAGGDRASLPPMRPGDDGRSPAGDLLRAVDAGRFSTHASFLLSRPAVWLIRFYRTQLRPALGRRCSMQPSCSAYSLEAFRTHGLLGVPLTADRLVREPDHVARRLSPVIVDGVERYADPVSDHTGWFGAKP